MEIFTEGLTALAGDQEVNTASAASKETELWTKYIAWCEERQQDKNVSEVLRKKVNSFMFLTLFKKLT